MAALEEINKKEKEERERLAAEKAVRIVCCTYLFAILTLIVV